MSVRNEETEIGHVGALLRKLVRLHVPPEKADSVLPIAARLLESSLGTAPSLQSTESLTKAMLFRLVRDRRHTESSRLANAASSLKFQRGVTSEAIWPVLYVLHDLSGSADDELRSDTSGMLNKQAATENDSASSSLRPSTEIIGTANDAATSGTNGSERRRALAPVSANPFLSQNESATEQMEPELHTSDEDDRDITGKYGGARHRNEHGERHSGSKHNAPVQLQNASLQKVLVQDLLLVVQGENGTLLSFGSEEADESVKLNLPDDTDVSLATRDIIQYVAELGFLFRIIRRRIEEGQSPNQDESGHGKGETGQVSENMYRGVAREMDTYYRSLMTLQSLNGVSGADDDASESLTLRRIFVWADREKPRLRWLARICDETRGLQGGQILALLRKRRGSYVAEEIRDMITRILAHAAAPINRMLIRWLAEGELCDDYGEFYIKEDPKIAASMEPASYSGSALIEESSVTSGLAGVVNMASLASHRTWWGLFKMRKDMLPGAVNSELAQKSLIAGKSVAFLRRCCGDSLWVDRVHAPLVALITAGDKSLFEADFKFDKDVVREVIEKSRESACKRLKRLFFDKFDLSHHFGAIKRYLLLSQGDFAQALMDQLAPILDGAGNMVRSTLTGSVDAALQGSSSFNEDTDEDILERLDVQIISDGVSGLMGWDVFSLTYRVQDAPLNTVFSEKVMEAYLLIFRFLWKLKRMDHLMTKAFLNLRDVDASKRSRIVNVRENESICDGLEVRDVLKRAHHLRMKMTHVVHNLQHYCTVEVLEGSWAILEHEMTSAEDLDGMIQAHAKYLTVIKDRTLLSERSEYVANELDSVLSTIPEFSQVQDEICTWIQMATNGGDGGEDEKSEEIVRKLESIEDSFDESFKKLLMALSKHTRMVETCMFLLFRLDFNKYYARRSESIANMRIEE